MGEIHKVEIPQHHYHVLSRTVKQIMTYHDIHVDRCCGVYEGYEEGIFTRDIIIICSTKSWIVIMVSTASIMGMGIELEAGVLCSLRGVQYPFLSMFVQGHSQWLYICNVFPYWLRPLRWRHNDHAGVSNHQSHGCLLNRLFRRKSKKTSKLRVTGHCAGNSPGTGEFPAQMASYAENVSIWWRHHALIDDDGSRSSLYVEPIWYWEQCVD